MKTNLPNLLKQRNVYFARLVVPPDVREIIGKGVLKQSTGEADPVRAALKAKPIVDAWKQRIAEARAGGRTAHEMAVASMAAQYRRLQEKADPSYGSEMDLEDIIDWSLKQRGIVLKGEAVVPEGEEEKAEKLPPAVQQDVAAITGTATPFLTHLEAWKSQAMLTGRQLAMYVSDLKAFAAETNCTLQALQGRDVQRWIEAKVKTVSPATVQRKLAPLRNYWRWLQSHEYVPEDRKPFDDRHIPAPKRQDPDAKRRAFTPADVVRLWQEASGRGDDVLEDVIRIAAYTGGRIEEICTLTVADVDLKARTIRLDSKTEAGNRLVPIHPEIMPVLVRRLGEGGNSPSDKGRFLIPSTAQNQYALRSDPIGKRFGRLKAGLGFGPQLVFHSIRKTVATLLHDAACPEPIAADIIGHEIGTMTYGVYSAGSAMDTRRDWIERALNYPGG